MHYIVSLNGANLFSVLYRPVLPYIVYMCTVLAANKVVLVLEMNQSFK